MSRKTEAKLIIVENDYKKKANAKQDTSPNGSQMEETVETPTPHLEKRERELLTLSHVQTSSSKSLRKKPRNS